MTNPTTNQGSYGYNPQPASNYVSNHSSNVVVRNVYNEYSYLLLKYISTPFSYYELVIKIPILITEDTNAPF